MGNAWTLAKKDLKTFFADRRAAVITVLVPIAIACFMAMIFSSGGDSNSSQKARLAVLIVDEDRSELSEAIIKSLIDNRFLDPKIADRENAKEQVRSGKKSLAILIPKGFGDQAPQAMFFGNKPNITLLYDPSQYTNVQIVSGALMQTVMEQVSSRTFSKQNIGVSRSQIMNGDLPADEKAKYGTLFDSIDSLNANQESQESSNAMQQPFTISEQAIAAESADAEEWGAAAHIFGGMAIQGVLFFGIEAGMAIMRDRRLGIWKRLKASPVKHWEVVLSKAVSASLTSLFVLAMVFLAGSLLFHIRVTGSWVGFGAVCLMTSIVTASFGLFLASLGKTEQQSRGFSVLAVLMMSMLGGAWFPSAIMPPWVQSASMFVPVKWAVDGFDSFLWRGSDLSAVGAPVLGLTAFTIAFGWIALVRLKKLQAE